MANGRHARGAQHLAAHLDHGPQAEVPVEAPEMPLASGRRRRVAEVSTTPVPEDLPRPAAPETDAVTSFGTGRRRRTAPEPEAVLPAPTGRRRRSEPEAEAVLPAPAGRRRRLPDVNAAAPVEAPAAPVEAPAAPVEAPAAPVEAPAAPVEAAEPNPGPGRRRRASETPAVPAAPVIELVADLAPVSAAMDEPVVEVVEVAAGTATVTELAPRSHRRAATTKKAPARSSGGHAARTAGGHAARRKNAALPTPSGTSLIAGAAAVAVAAAGAIGATNSGAEPATAANAAMSGAAALGVPEVAAAPLPEVASVEREQVRASRERARDALADRVAAAAAAQKKQEAAARALAAAKVRAQQLALIAKSYSLPVSGYRLTAGFGEGGYRWSSSHTGLDFACAYGSPIRAVAAGTVIFAGYDGSYGWKTIIRHANGTESWYAHQSQILVRRGQVVAGQIIGRVGMTGNTSGPHLHLEIRVHDNPVNPLSWFRAHGLRP